VVVEAVGCLPNRRELRIIELKPAGDALEQVFFISDGALPARLDIV
jgi:hypothetical protein